jgi:hypothetical protein
VAFTSTGTLGFAGAAYRTWRNGRSTDRKVDVDEADGIRDHWAAELAALRTQIIQSGERHAEREARSQERYEAGLAAANARHDAAMDAADEREAACQAQVRELRLEVRDLSAEIIGLRRQLGQSARSAIVIATHAVSEDIQHSADRAAAALDALGHAPQVGEVE